MNNFSFSLFSSVSDRNPETITLDQFEEMITDGEWQPQVSIVRASKEKKAAKKKLPAVTVSGVFNDGHKADDLQNHSSLICMDFDLKDNPSLASGAGAMREKLAKDKYSKLAFISVGSEGLAVVCEIDPEQHKSSFEVLSTHFREQYGLVADKSCKDVSRLRFVSWDAEAKLNKQAECVEVLHSTIEKGTEVLGYYDTTVLCNKVTRLTTADQYTEAFEEKLTFNLYKKLVEQQFSAKKGARNSTLTQKLIPFLFGAVTEVVAMEWVKAFYWYNAGIFNDPIEQHMEEAHAAWKRCQDNYYDSLTKLEREFYTHLSTTKQAESLTPLFRICRSLARAENDTFPLGIFALSGEQCKLRLGLDHNEQGKRLRDTMHNKYNLIEIERYGKSRSKGCSKGIANVYRWKLDSLRNGSA